MQKHLISDLETPERIDTYLLNVLDVSRSKVQKMINDKNVLVNDNKVKSSYLLKNGDVVTIKEINETTEILPENIKLDIVYEDDDVIVINKGKGMIVHPANNIYSGTLVNALLHHTTNLSDVNGEERRGIVHRLDADTTGLLIVAKNNEAHTFLAKQFEEKKVVRKYMAIVWGVINNDTGTIDAPIGRDINNRKKLSVTSINSKKAITHFKVLERFSKATLIELELETGRTHQIRVHMDYINYPVVNDPLYGRRKRLDETGQTLHSNTLGFIHPKSGEYMEFKSELPSTFLNILEQIKLM